MKAILKNKSGEIVDTKPLPEDYTPRIILDSERRAAYMHSGQEGEGYVYREVEWWKI